MPINNMIVKPAMMGGSEVRLPEIALPFSPQVFIKVRLTIDIVRKIPIPPNVGTFDPWFFLSSGKS